MDNKSKISQRKYVVNIKRVITYTAVVRADYPQDAEKLVLDCANDPRRGFYEIDNSSSITEINDTVLEAQAVSEFKGNQWFDPDFERKFIESTDYSQYGFVAPDSPVPYCRCDLCAPFHKDHPDWEKRQKQPE